MNRKKQRLLPIKGLLPITAKTLQNLLGPDCVLQGIEPESSFCDVVPTNCSTVHSGSLFIPLYETDAECVEKVHRGALAVLTDHPLPDVPTIIVSDRMKAMLRICLSFIETISLPAIAVTGSTGKTSTKRMIYSVLKTKKQVFSELENNNTLYDLCRSLQLVEPDHEMIVQEVDESRWHNIYNCSIILKPRIVAVTNIAESHMGYVGSKEALIRTFRGITAGMPEDGIVIINGDDPDSLRAEFNRRVIRVGIRDQSCECVARNIRTGPGGTRFDLCYDGRRIPIRLRVFGEHNVYNAMMAYLCGRLSGLKDRAIRRGLARFRNMGIRQNIVRVSGVTVYADCYNASLRSVGFALKCFCDLKTGKGKRMAILGDIAEIEGFEEETYRQIAALLDASTVDAVITFGKDSKVIGEYLTRDLTRYHAGSHRELKELLNQHKKEYRAFLFKASRIMRLEDCVSEVFPKHYRRMRFQERVALKQAKGDLAYLPAVGAVLKDAAAKKLRRGRHRS